MDSITLQDMGPSTAARNPHTTWIAFSLTVLLFSVVATISLNPPSPHVFRALHRRLPKPVLALYGRMPLPRSLLSPSGDLAIAVRSFSDYSFAQQKVVNSKFAAFERMPRRHRALGNKLAWKTKLEAVEDAIETNARVTDELAAIGLELATRSGEPVGIKSAFSRQDGRVVEVLKHFVRDWADEGRVERQTLFPPILDALRGAVEDGLAGGSPSLKALIPGCGLGRLAYEIADLGFETDANDYSHFMNIGAQLIFRRTQRPRQHSIRPWIHNLSHQRNALATIREIQFPDIVPRQDIPLRFVAGDFLDLFREDAIYDAVVTLFFIDTASNLCDYFEKIWRVLKPGGVWINEGPLLYYGNPAMALPLEDVIKLAELIGFTIEHKRSLKGVSYTADVEGMYNFTYDCEFWVARKPAVRQDNVATDSKAR